MQPPFNRHGNKYPIRDVILPLIPPHSRFIELFAGTGAIFFNKDKAKENILNDLDYSVYDRLKLIQKAPLDLKKYPANLHTLEDAKYFFNNHSNTIGDKIILYKIISSTGFSSKPVHNTRQMYHHINIYRFIEKIPLWKEKLKDVLILNKDYADVVKQYDTKNAFFFIDPPYENTNKTFGYAEDVDFDFERLKDVLHSIKGYFLMTINDSPYTRKLFKDFIVKPILVPTGWQSHKNKEKHRKELIVMNYILGK